MRKLLLALFASCALSVSAQGFIDPLAKIAKHQHERKMALARTRGEVVNENARMKLFVTCQNDANTSEVAEGLKAAGALVRVKKGQFMAIEVPYSKLESLANVEGVAIVSMPPKISKKTDTTRKVTQADEVIDGSGAKLPQAYTGKGVMVGVIDAGFDVTHPMFKDKDGNLRIKGFYQVGDSKFGGEKITITFDSGETMELSGSAYTKAEDILDTLKVKDVDGSHGVHCASIAAGSHISDVKGLSDAPLGGIAPEADLLLCNINHSDSEYEGWDFVEALYFLEWEAYLAGKPLVVSLSMNSHMGWHDGWSPTAYYLGSFCKDDGVALSLCTSNEGGFKTYLHEKAAAKDTLRLIPYTGYTDNYCWGGLKTDKNVKMEVGIINLDDKKEYYRVPITFNSDGSTKYGNGLYFDFDDDTQKFENEEETAAKAEFKNYIKSGAVQIFCYQNEAMKNEKASFVFSNVYVSLRGTEWAQKGNWGFNLYLIPDEATELHAWADQGFNVAAVRSDGTWVDGDGSVSVGDFNCSGEPVSIGAWCANDKVKEEGKSASTSSMKKGRIASFSSYGTDLAGHKHPDGCTPGCNIIAALNSFDPSLEAMSIYERKGYKDQFVGQKDKRDYFFGTMSGTSMSTPAAAGIMALWAQAALDKGKVLTSRDIKDIVAHACDTDSYTEATPERFGAGKINAYKGLLYVLDAETNIPTLSKNQPENVTFRVAGDVVYADGAENGTPVTVYNLQGVTVRETTVQGGSFSTAGLQKGVYAIQLGKLGSTLIRK